MLCIKVWQRAVIQGSTDAHFWGWLKIDKALGLRITKNLSTANIGLCCSLMALLVDSFLATEN